MARRVTVVRDYLNREFGIEMSEEEIITNFCPTAIQYDIYKLGIHIEKNTCITTNCTECWNEEV